MTKDKIPLYFDCKGRISPGWFAFFRVYRGNPCARRAFLEPFAKGYKRGAFALGPNFDIAGIKVFYPAYETEPVGFSACGVSETDSLDPAGNPGMEGGNGTARRCGLMAAWQAKPP
jgi:hypothetical protein